MQARDKLLSMLGLCRKAGKLVYGFDAVSQSAKNHGAYLILTSNDLSPKSRKEIEFTANKENVETVPIPVTMKEIGDKTGRRAGILAITDRNLAESVKTARSRVYEEE